MRLLCSGWVIIVDVRNVSTASDTVHLSISHLNQSHLGRDSLSTTSAYNYVQLIVLSNHQYTFALTHQAILTGTIARAITRSRSSLWDVPRMGRGTAELSGLIAIATSPSASTAARLASKAPVSGRTALTGIELDCVPWEGVGRDRSQSRENCEKESGELHVVCFRRDAKMQLVRSFASCFDET